MTFGKKLGMGLTFVTTGIVITDLRIGGAATRCGLEEGDIIEQVNEVAVTSSEEWNNALQDAGEEVTLTVRKSGSNEVLKVDVPAKAFLDR